MKPWRTLFANLEKLLIRASWLRCRRATSSSNTWPARSRQKNARGYRSILKSNAVRLPMRVLPPVPLPLSPAPGGSSLVDVLSLEEKALSLQDVMSTSTLRLHSLVPFDSIAVYAVRGDVIVARFALGENARQLSSLCVPMGQGLVGWVAETGNYIINGNPTVEPGLDGLNSRVSLRSGLAVPLTKGTRIIGVLAVYGLNTDAFTPEHLNVIQASAKYLVDVIAEKLDGQEPQLTSRTGWRHRIHLGSRARESV